MKTRSSFVSNSSSSSFIVMYNDSSRLSLCMPESTEEVMAFTIDDLMDLVDRPSWHSEATELKANGAENVVDYLSEDDYSSGYYDLVEKEHYTSREAHEEVRRRVAGMISKAMTDGGFSDVAVLQVSYDDKFTRKILEGFIKSGQMKDLQYAWCDKVIDDNGN